MEKINLRNGKEVIIRKAKKEDTQNMINFYNFVGGETDFLSFGKNEFKKDVNDYKNYIESINREDNSIILLTTINDEIISIASIDSTQKARDKHVGTFGIVIEEKYCGLGLGRKLMDYLIEWARSNGTTKKISLLTREDNYRAIQLYRKVGFKEEGILKNHTLVNGVYFNLIMMGLLI